MLAYCMSSDFIGKHPNDSGSTLVQLSQLNEEIENATLHLKSNPKDNQALVGLTKKVGHRNRLLKYLSKHKKDMQYLQENSEKYTKIATLLSNKI